MIRLCIERDRDKRVTAIESSGHAGYADRGEDIVCAAVSMLFINTNNAIEQLTDCEKIEKIPGDGHIRIEFPKGADRDAMLLIDAMILGIRTVIGRYGKEYAELTEIMKKGE